jgi:hypothetical protein
VADFSLPSEEHVTLRAFLLCQERNNLIVVARWCLRARNDTHTLMQHTRTRTHVPICSFIYHNTLKTLNAHNPTSAHTQLPQVFGVLMHRIGLRVTRV